MADAELRRLSFTQPSCAECWSERNPNRTAHRMVVAERDDETCAYCGRKTRSGIYVRVDPKTVPYPTKEKD